MAALSGFDEDYRPIRAERRDRKAGKSRTAAEIGDALERGQHLEERSRVEDQAASDRLRIAVTREIDPSPPPLDEKGEVDELLERRGCMQIELPEASR